MTHTHCLVNYSSSKLWNMLLCGRPTHLLRDADVEVVCNGEQRDTVREGAKPPHAFLEGGGGGAPAGGRAEGRKGGRGEGRKGGRAEGGSRRGAG